VVKANIKGEFLPWRDVLHNGPVPDHLCLEALSKIRSSFIIDCGWGNADDIRKDFVKRDNTLKSFQNYSKVILWFEHDLYDQLQLIQILDWFYQQPKHHVPLALICTDNYLGPLTPDELLKLQQYEEAITPQQLNLASKAWSAFRSQMPTQWLALLGDDLFSLPFLKSTVLRLLEEYPSSYNGLSRTETQALTIINNSTHNPGKVFAENQAMEGRVYMGDSSFWIILNQLLSAKPPLLSLTGATQLNLPITKEHCLSITKLGKEVLLGKSHYSNYSIIDYWLGGVHLSKDNYWCWDSTTSTIIEKISTLGSV